MASTESARESAHPLNPLSLSFEDEETEAKFMNRQFEKRRWVQQALLAALLAAAIGVSGNNSNPQFAELCRFSAYVEILALLALQALHAMRSKSLAATLNDVLWVGIFSVLSAMYTFYASSRKPVTLRDTDVAVYVIGIISVSTLLQLMILRTSARVLLSAVFLGAIGATPPWPPFTAGQRLSLWMLALTVGFLVVRAFEYSERRCFRFEGAGQAIRLQETEEWARFAAQYTDVSKACQQVVLVFLLALVSIPAITAVIIDHDLAFAVPIVVGWGLAALSFRYDWWRWLRVTPQVFHAIQLVHIITSVVQCSLGGVEDYHTKLKARAAHVATILLVYFTVGALLTQATVALPPRMRAVRLAITPALVLVQAAHVYIRTSDLHISFVVGCEYIIGMYAFGLAVTLGCEVVLLRLWRRQERMIEELKQANRHLSDANENNVKAAMDLAAYAVDANMRLALRSTEDDDVDDENDE